MSALDTAYGILYAFVWEVWMFVLDSLREDTTEKSQSLQYLTYCMQNLSQGLLLF